MRERCNLAAGKVCLRVDGLVRFAAPSERARGGNRTRIALQLRDFKSLASTSFATRALR